MSGDPRLKRTQPGGSAVTAAARASDARQAVRDRRAVAGFAPEGPDGRGGQGGEGARLVLFAAKANGAFPPYPS
ncbi:MULTISPECIES: hypothetical protein [unclassified Streptomyces]|uniref:hypothetical protein n=1 Tax=unclassified Streptomyces TaxID=2593676 RepID=UPI00109D1AC0|nr:MULTISPECIES: hypothetical protein [unclassified Streptomyces]MCE3034969.1 hypothetical protein [Streptomyces sp. CMSTAAHL-2]TGZ13835.1 hypothetical protein DV517_53180 [Streptomyces sp. S816]